MKFISDIFMSETTFWRLGLGLWCLMPLSTIFQPHFEYVMELLYCRNIPLIYLSKNSVYFFFNLKSKVTAIGLRIGPFVKMNK